MSQFPDNNPYQSPEQSFTPGSHHASKHEQARAKVNLPAIFMLVLAPLAIIFFGVDLFFRAVNDPADNPFLQNMENNPDAQAGAEVGVVIGGAMDVLGIVLQFVVIFGALQMRQLKSYSMAMAASIISCIPCLTACCILGIPFGIWGLVALNDPMVKQAFES